MIQQGSHININGRLWDFKEPKVMGILNVTPDSFYDGGRHNDFSTIRKKVLQMRDEKVDIIDIGGYSTKPRASEVSLKDEKKRVLDGIKIIFEMWSNAVVSVDTFRAEVARAAVGEGAAMINDIGGGTLDPDMIKTVPSLRVPYVMMHIKGTPQNMPAQSEYRNGIIPELMDFFSHNIARFHDAGVKDILIDPGFGFAKKKAQSYELLDKLSMLKVFGKPIIAGLSRKGMIYNKLGVDAENSLNGTTALNTVAVRNGASILRVHDINEAKQVVNLLSK